MSKYDNSNTVNNDRNRVIIETSLAVSQGVRQGGVLGALLFVGKINGCNLLRIIKLN